MPAALPTSDAIHVALRAHGVPEPERLDPVPSLGRRVARVRLEGRDWLARFVVDTPTCAPERGLLAGATWGETLPIPGPAVVLRQGLVVPGLLHPLPPGRPASATDGGLRAVGRALAALRDHPLPHRGTLDTASGFAPRAARWSEAQRELAARDHGSALAQGTDLGPLSTALVDLVAARSEALDAGALAVPVHGRLDPRRVFVDDTGEITAILGWERACAGDPEQDWAPLVLADGLAEVMAGFGDPSTLRSPGAIARLEAHVARFLLGALADLADDAPAVRAGRQQALALATRALLDGAVARRLADPACALPQVDPLDALSRQALLCLGERPDPTRGARATTALALVGLARRHPSQTEPLARHAAAQLAAIPAAGWPRAVPEAVDRQGWLAELGMLAVGEATDDPPLGQAAAALWLVHDALEQLRWEVPSQVLYGLRAHLFALRSARGTVEATAGQTRGATAIRTLANGLLAAAAFQELRPALEHDVQPMVEGARERLSRAASTLDYPALAARGIAGDVASALPQLVERDRLEGPAALLPQLLLCLDCLGADTWRVVPAAALVSLV